MKYLVIALLVILAFAAPVAVGGQARVVDNHSHAQDAGCPNSDCVPDEKTAVRIAEAVLIPIYGEKHIMGEHPFKARLEGDRWIVAGSLPKPKHTGEIVVGGTATAEIAKKDGRIIAVYHMK